MASKKFITSVADYYFYDTSDVLLCSGKTLLDTSLDVKLASTEVRGGRGNQLQYIYWHTGAMSIQLTDAQWNLAALANAVGKSITTGNSVYTEESVTLGGSGGGTVVGTPLAIQGTALYGYVTQLDGTIERVTFSGSTFASSTGTSGDVVCVRFFATDAASRSFQVPANAIPKIGRLVLEAQLNSSDESANKIGVVQIIIPKAQLSGAFTISLKSDGVGNTPLMANALAYNSTATASCTSEPIYAEVIEILDNANWYDGVTALSIEGGNFALNTGNTPLQLVVYAIRPGDAPFLCPVADLDFTSGTVGACTIGLHTGKIMPEHIAIYGLF